MGTFVGTSANGGNVTAITNANGTPITWPSVASGDLAILAWSMQNTATPTDPTSQTFSLVGTVDDGSDRLRILKRVCTGSESGTISGWSNSLQNRQTAVLFVVRGFSDVVGVFFQETVTGTTHDCPSIGTGNGAATGDRIIVVASDRSGATTTATPPAGFSKRTTSEFGLAAAGGTYTGVADDGLVTPQTMPFDPAAWSGMTSSGTAITATLALRPIPVNATGDRTATATLSGAATASLTGAGDRTATATLAGAAAAMKSAAGDIAATASLLGAAVVSKLAGGDLVATAALTGAASVVHVLFGSGDATASATLSGAALVDHQTSGDFSATALLTGAGTLTKTGAGDLSAVATLAGDALASRSAVGDLAAVATLTGAAEVFPHFDPALRTTATARRPTATASVRAGSSATARRPSATATVRSPA